MLEISDIAVTYGSTRALDGVSLGVQPGSVLAIMGESGSGKSTLLRAIAGLVPPAAGSVLWNGTDVTEVPTHERSFGLMFQDYALFPHLSVGENVAFGLRMHGWPVTEQQSAVQQLLELVGLTGYSGRNVAELSGGEQQRVALARTLAPEPGLILLDEPLGALDRARRGQLLADMQRIFTAREVTALYVTHDHQEAFAIADEVAVLHEGSLVRRGTPSELWSAPGNAAVATLIGFPVLELSVVDNRATIGGADIPLRLPDGTHHLALAPGAVRVTTGGDVSASVVAIRFEEGVTKALVDLHGQEIIAGVEGGEGGEGGTVPLGPVRVTIDRSRLIPVVA